MIGKTLGNYEILGELGKGGMGEVYRARDTRLDREVAVKILPAEIANSPEVQSRFDREAKTISSLNHPHICVLHDVGVHEGVHFLVMELVDGLTLGQRLDKGPLPIDEVLRYGAQIADALDRAHRAGVIHRDLKPGNVMITRTGAKLMDFGLARIAPLTEQTDLTVDDGPASPTVAHPLTAEGAIIGTFQYMAPEQLEGQDVDHRSDLWALGCVLYEMATGERAFGGATQASLIGAIMHQQPVPVSERVELTPPEFDRLVSACLTKDPTERVQSAHDIKLQLQWLAEGSGVTTAPAIPRTRKRRWPSIAMTAVAAAIIGAAAIWFTRGPATPDAELSQRYGLGEWDLVSSSTPSISPDGTYVVFAVREGVSSRIYRRDLNSLDAVPVAGTEGGRAPFLSPDGRWLGFVTTTAIHKVPTGGGFAQLISDIAGINSADWGLDGTIYLSPRGGGESGDVALYRVSANGGPVDVFARLEEGETDVWLPEVLPGGETVLLSVLGVRDKIVAFRSDGSRETVINDAFLGRYAEPGYLFYRDDTSEAMIVVPFDPGTARITGGALAITENIHANYCFDVSSDGMLVYVPSADQQEARYLVWAYPDGTTKHVSEVTGTWTQPRVSPDGNRILVRKTGAKCELWILDLERGSFSRIIQDDDAHDPVWSPDGRNILFDRSNAGEVVTCNVSGPRVLHVVASGPGRGTPGSWSATGNLFAYTVTGQGGQDDIWVRRMDGDSEAEPFLTTLQSEREPVISADGRWIAYTAEDTGIPEVYVRSRPDDGAAWQVSTGGGNSPLWSRDGSELYYLRAEDEALMSVSVDTSEGLVLGVPEVLMTGNISRSRARDYDVTPDGSFVTVSGDAGQANMKMRVLLNWPQLVKEMGGD